MDLCSKHEALVSHVPAICRRRGIQLMHADKFASALYWLVKAGDVFSVESVCDRFMQRVFVEEKDE